MSRPARAPGARLTLAACLAAWSLSGCIELPLTPARELRSPRRPPQPAPVMSDQAPRLRLASFQRIDSTLHVVLHFDRRDPRQRNFYDPATAGGWSLQLFMNADQQPTGYADGFDFLVRGTEFIARHEVPIRYTTGEPAGPGGWGPVAATVPFLASGTVVMFPIPLGTIDDDGLMDWTLETYATVACGDCPGGATGEYVESWSGTTGHGRTDLRAGRPVRFGAGPRASYGLARLPSP